MTFAPRDNDILGRYSGAPIRESKASLQQLLAVTALITALERVCSSGVLSEADEGATRMLICKACNVFLLPSIAERTSNVIDLDTAVEALVRKEMERQP